MYHWSWMWSLGFRVSGLDITVSQRLWKLRGAQCLNKSKITWVDPKVILSGMFWTSPGQERRAQAKPNDGRVLRAETHGLKQISFLFLSLLDDSLIAQSSRRDAYFNFGEIRHDVTTGVPQGDILCSRRVFSTICHFQFYKSLLAYYYSVWLSQNVDPKSCVSATSYVSLLSRSLSYKQTPTRTPSPTLSVLNCMHSCLPFFLGDDPVES